MFKANKIHLDSETVAERLRSARQNKKIKLEQAAKILNINERYLSALEKGEYWELPKGVYGKNFLREYALFLSLDYQQLAEDYQEEINIAEPKKQKGIFAKQVIKGRHLWVVPKIIKNILIFLIICICFVYLGYRLDRIITPPLLTVDNPAKNLTTNADLLLVSGQTEAEASLAINGQMVLSDKNGKFSKMINLKNGLNIITITASKKYSRDNTITRQILLKTPAE